jgi:hypothetical protein
MSSLRTLLVQGGIISPFDLAPGFPGVLPHGTDVVERYQQQYLEALTARFPVTEVTTPLLLPSEGYRSDYGLTYDYANTFELALDGTAHMVRPDSLAAMIRLAVAHGTGSVLVCRQPLFRSETADPQPFVRDRHIWGVIQAVHHCRPDQGSQSVLRRHAEAVLDLCTALRIPTLLVRASPLRDHASQRLLTFCLTSAGQLWLTSTIYQIAPPLATRLGATGPVIEVGVTAKLVALAALLHRDEAGLRLPTALAPACVEIPRDAAAQVAGELDRAGLRYASGTQSFRAAIGWAEKSGTPLAIGQGRAWWAVYSRASRTVARVRSAGDTVGTAITALSAHDDALMAAAVSAQNPLYDVTADADGWLDHLPRLADAPGHLLGTVLWANYPLKISGEHDAIALIGRKPRFY